MSCLPSIWCTLFGLGLSFSWLGLPHPSQANLLVAWIPTAQYNDTHHTSRRVCGLSSFSSKPQWSIIKFASVQIKDMEGWVPPMQQERDRWSCSSGVCIKFGTRGTIVFFIDVCARMWIMVKSPLWTLFQSKIERATCIRKKWVRETSAWGYWFGPKVWGWWVVPTSDVVLVTKYLPHVLIVLTLSKFASPACSPRICFAISMVFSTFLVLFIRHNFFEILRRVMILGTIASLTFRVIPYQL